MTKTTIVSHAVQMGLRPVRGIKNIITIASGKGGVGKSTTAVNLALALSMQGARVGILDADIYGPSIPIMLGVQQKPVSQDGKTMQPLRAHGLQMISIGLLIETDTAMIWRGPMVTKALKQLLYATQWQNLDYLIVDLPPGTGDIHLTMAQKIPVAGAVIVTTPQDIALADVKRSWQMFTKLKVSILGIVENMSYYRCPHCGHKETIFGQQGGEVFSATYQLPLLAQLPLNKQIRHDTDQGCPTVVVDPDSELTRQYLELATGVATELAKRPSSLVDKIPEVVVKPK